MATQFKFAFFGSDEFSIGVLNHLKKENIFPAIIVSVPDKPKGRGQLLSAPPIVSWANENKIPVIQPDKLAEQTTIEKLKNFDLFIVASYGKIIPQEILDLPKRGSLNVHPSLLPKYRGATPIENAILSGDQKTGTTIILLDEKMDHGPILAQESTDLTNWEPYYEELRDKLADMGGSLLERIITDWLDGKLEPIPQDENLATYTKKISKADGEIKLSDNPEINFRKIRALSPWPGTYFFIEKNNKPMRILVKKATHNDNILHIEKVLPEGKKEMDWESFEKGYLKE